MTAVNVVILAAGKGTRMKSRMPKVLHRLAGRALVLHVINTVTELSPSHVVVVTGHGADAVEESLAPTGCSFARQEPQLGTGHAVQQAMPHLPAGTDGSVTVILNGDVPLIQEETIRGLITEAALGHLALLTVHMPDPAGYGRIVRLGNSNVQAIVEHKDATPGQLHISEVYTGVMAMPTVRLAHWLEKLDSNNAQGEFYLTDIVKFAVAEGAQVVGVEIKDRLQVDGVNSPAQLATLEREWQLRQANALLEQGVRLADPGRLDIRGSLVCSTDVEIDVNCIFEGHVTLGEGVRIGANCVIANARIEDGATIHPFTHIDGEKLGVTVGEDALVGPFARLRPGASLGKDVHIGNFVEVKNSTLAAGAKANHLAYLGDSIVGERVNFGAGSITANYDGANKHQTVIEADVHVGSNCVLVAPVTIGAGGTVGGGSTITKDSPAGALSVARGKQVSIANWKRPAKIQK